MIQQENGNKTQPLLRALIGSMSEELSKLKGSYQTRVIREFNAGDDVLYLESTYGFPANGEVYVAGHLVRYFAVANNEISELLTTAESIAVGEVVTISTDESKGQLAAAHSAMTVGRSSDAMLDVIGNNHNVPRYYDVDDEQYRNMIMALAYMAGRGTDDSIELFLDTILDHQSLCGEATMFFDTSGTAVLEASGQDVAPFGGLLTQHSARLDVVWIAPNGDITSRRHRITSLLDADDSGEFFYKALLLDDVSPEYDPTSDWTDLLAANNGSISVLWRVVPYRVWENPYKRIERTARVGAHPYAEDVQQSVGNTVMVDLLLPQPESSVGVGYVAGQMVFKSDQKGGLFADGRLRKVGQELRFYLKGMTTTHQNIDGLREYMSAYPRQVLAVRRVVDSAATFRGRRSELYLPVGANLCSTNDWRRDGDDFYVRLAASVDSDLSAYMRAGGIPPTINHLRVDFGEVETPRAGDLHTAGLDLQSRGEIGVTGGVATAQLLPNVNTRNPSYMPPVVVISAASFVAGGTLEVNLLTEYGTEYTQRLSLPSDLTFAQLSSDLRDVSASSPSYVLDFFYSAGYQVDQGTVYGLRLFSYAELSNTQIKIYMVGDNRASLSIAPIEDEATNNVSFGYSLPYVSPDPFVPRQKIDYYPLYLGERNILLLGLIGDIITVAGVIPEITSFTFQAYANHRRSWRALLDEKTRRLSL